MRNNKSLREAALGYLARRDYSRTILQSKLLRKGYEAQEIDEYLDTLTERGYLNDAALCRRLYEEYLQVPQMGYFKIRFKLLQQGFSREVIESLLQFYNFKDEEEKLEQFLLKNHQHGITADEVPKLVRSLTTKGFTNENIRKVLRQIIE